MLNKEKYAKEIFDTACKGSIIAVTLDGKLTSCNELNCEDCSFREDDCNKGISKWCESEYVEPPVDWSKVAVDTPIIVRISKDCKWQRRHFAKYENGYVYAWNDGKTSWTAGKNEVYGWQNAKLAESEGE